MKVQEEHTVKKTRLKTIKSFRTILLDIDSANSAASTSIMIKEPNCSVGVRDGEREIGDSCPIASISNTGIKTVDGGISVMGWNARAGESGLGSGVVSKSN